MGQEYINVTKYNGISLYDFVRMVENLTNKKYELTDNISKKYLLNLLKTIAEDFKENEIDQQEKTKRFELR